MGNPKYLPKDFENDTSITEFGFNEADNMVGLRTHSLVTKEILAANREENANWGKSSPWKHALKHNWVKVSSVDNVILDEWAKEWGINMGSKEFTQRWIMRVNDPSYAGFRTAPGKLGNGKSEPIIVGPTRRAGHFREKAKIDD